MQTITMMQTVLIEPIIQNKSNTNEHCLLDTDNEGSPRHEHWNYHSGKSYFLAQNTRHDISFAVHQCTRFCSKPTVLHEVPAKQ